ncbi:unnamed protein product [Musa textilis]
MRTSIVCFYFSPSDFYLYYLKTILTGVLLILGAFFALANTIFNPVLHILVAQITQPTRKRKKKIIYWTYNFMNVSLRYYCICSLTRLDKTTNLTFWVDCGTR